MSSSINLPTVTNQMLNEFLESRPEFNQAEFRYEKLRQAGRPGYVKQAIGRVKIERNGPICTVTLEMSPEHRLHDNNYIQIVTIDEFNRKIVNSVCNGCVSRNGGCKHSVAALSFLLLESNEPSPTSSSCYWRPPPLNSVRTRGVTVKLAEIKSGGVKTTFDQTPRNTSIFEKWKQRAVDENLNCQILPYLTAEKSVDKISMDLLVLKFKEEHQRNRSLANFIRFIKNVLTTDICKEVEESTRCQSSSKFWHNLRFGRMTASNLYEITKCNTKDGSLVQRLLGGKIFKPTPAMRRGIKLETEIFEILKKKFPDIRKAGLHLSNDFPLYGASPDAESTDFVFEMKCPISNDTKLSYINNGEVQPKVKAQISLQMLLANKKSGFLVVADPEFETNKKIELHQINLDKKYCSDLMALANKFYNQNVFPKMMERI